MATRSDVETVNKGFYDLKTSLTTAEKQLTAEPHLHRGPRATRSSSPARHKELDPAAAPVVKALDHILSYAFEQRASDIHFEPKRDLTLVRLRIDGILHDVHLIPRIVYQAVVSRIKLLSGCNLAEKRRPQDGRIKREQGGREIELRVSTMPTAFGEKAVLRIFDPDILLKGIDELGLSAHDVPKFYDFIARPTGIILVTGPTGSGKTTTLYSVLKHLSKPEVNIVTIEDPIEMVFEDFNQVAVRPQIDITFASAPAHGAAPGPRHHHGRRDPRHRDRRARGAGRAHRPPRALHPAHQRRARPRSRACSTSGVPHFLITSTLIGVLAQRLVREICTHCTEEYAPTPEEAAAPAHGPGEAEGVQVPARAAAACTAGRPATAGAPASSRCCRMTREGPRAWSPRRPASQEIFKAGARGGHADAARGGDREGLPRHHHHDGDGPGHRQVAGPGHSGPDRARAMP